MRISYDRGRNFHARNERKLTDELPRHPAAVRIYGKDGTCRCICLDFDSSVHGSDVVDAEVRLLTQWLYDHGASWVADISPNGGQHVYVPFEHRLTFDEARSFVEALGTRYRTLDKSPHQSIASGCIRVPGSLHKTGGHQQLLMSLGNAYRILRTPNRTPVWESLSTDLADEVAKVRALRNLQPYPALDDDAPALDGGAHKLSKHIMAIATGRPYDAARYPSPSEARQAVLAAAARAGWTLLDVDRRMKQGAWPGLAQMYARYRGQHRAKALRRDWDNAVSFVAQSKLETSGKNNDRIFHTSQPYTQGGLVQGHPIGGAETEHRFIRSWRNVMAIREKSLAGTRKGLVRRMLLRAIGEAAHKSGSRFVQFGVRSLAVATGQDHSTVASHLREMRREKDGLFELVSEARGTKGDLYLLRIPTSLQDAAESLAWKKGRIHALRPVFRELGLPAAYLYEALEHSPTPLTTTELVNDTQLGRTAAAEGLEILAAWNLIARDPATRAWRLIRTTSLTALAEHFGVLDDVAAQVNRYRTERAAWHSWLAAHVNQAATLPSPGDDYPWEEFEGPPDEWTLSDMAFARAG